jgi:hypothetical protein
MIDYLNSRMTTEQFNSIIAVVTGQIFLVVGWLEIDVTNVVLKTGATICLAFLGGYFSLLGKECFIWTKNKIAKWIK